MMVEEGPGHPDDPPQSRPPSSPTTLGRTSMLSLIISGLALLLATASILVQLLNRIPPQSTPVEGVNDLVRRIRGRHVPRARMHKCGHGTVYTSSNR